MIDARLALIMCGLAAAGIAALLLSLIRAHRRLSVQHRRLSADFALLQGHNDRLMTAASDAGARRPSPRFDVDGQLAAVADPDVDIETRAILNGGERHVLAAVDAFVASHRAGRWRVFAQVALGELLTVRGPDAVARDLAFRAINAKRPDIVIVDGRGHAIAIVEYQGAGHDQGDAATRDAIKRTACERAGIAHIEIAEAATAADIGTILASRLAHRLDLSDAVV